MNDIFIERRLFTKHGDAFLETSIKIFAPKETQGHFSICKIEFSNVKRFDTIAKGVDQFNAIECALEYVNSICTNSEEPEFFITMNESMKNFQ